ncbi:unnamed protein product [Acanthoscelides obtectus]|uniref:Dachshund n=1 Tax=Acanthoscelides obtectus TaxID=200917 RepID=A0A9P0PRK4_ACAOB|nr:unnamed protein product [Acanthoscelides obtectus]CAK1685874.1 Dachshund homolog 1 [Acanthoscelides obtectus]
MSLCLPDMREYNGRLREERCDPDRPIPLDQKPRDLSPRNGSPTEDHSPVLNLSKTGGGAGSGGSLGDAEGDAEADHSGSEGPEGADAPPSPRSTRSPLDEPDDDDVSEAEDEEDKEQDMDDGDLPLPSAPSVGDSHQQALNYSTLASAVAATNGGGTATAGGGVIPGATAVAPPIEQTGVSSTETLLRNIQGLLKVAADNARQQERQFNYEKGTNSNVVYLLSLAQYYMYLAATQKC